MVESFVKLKKRAARNACLYALLTGVSSAAFVFGVLFIVCRLAELSFPLYGQILIAAGVGLLVGGILLALTYPTTKRFAKTLDKRYALGEKVQTMVEFSAQEGAILEMQRARTEEALQTLPKQKKGFKSVLKVGLLPFLAVAVVATSFALPQKGVAQPPVEPPEQEEIYGKDKFDVKDLEVLIKNVTESTLPDGLKLVYLAQLNGLMEKITAEEDIPLREVKAAVELSMKLIIDVTKEYNTYNLFVKEIGGDEGLAEKQATFVKALKDSGAVYKTVQGTNVYYYESLKGLDGSLYSGVQAALASYSTELTAPIDEITTQNAYRGYVDGVLADIEGVLALEGVVGLAETDGIKRALTTFKTELDATKDLFAADSGYGINDIKAEAKKVVGGLINGSKTNGGLASPLKDQANVVMLKDYVLATLSKIFGVDIPYEGEGEEPDDGPGGGGTGEGSRPNEGWVLDPADGTYKPYMDIVAKYYKNVSDLLDEDKNNPNGSQIPVELREYLEAYFNTLQKPEEKN